PYTLKGERKRSLPLGALAPAMAAPTGGSGDGSGKAAGVTPDASWAIVDVLQPVWEWRPWSANLHPLDAWGSQGPPDDGDERRRLRARFEADFLPVDLGILYETGVVEAITLNGARLNLTAARRPEPDEVELADEAARLVALRGAALARRGTNVLEATVRTPDSERIAFYDEITLGPVAVIGRFALRCSAGGCSLIRPPAVMAAGDWGVAGYPRYSGTATYRQGFALPDLPAGATVRLVVEAWDGVITASVNGRTLPVPASSPCAFEVSRLLRLGMNELALTVTTSLRPRLAGQCPAGLRAARLEYRAP
ncbi:MAG: hypothetical protein ACRDJN_14885, partial [Chloroflexota bacterium]